MMPVRPKQPSPRRRACRPSILALGFATSACAYPSWAPGGGLPAPPLPVEAAGAEVASLVEPLPPAPDPVGLLAPPPPALRGPDPILDSPWAHDPRIRTEVEGWVARMVEGSVLDLEGSLLRMGAFEPLVDGALASRGLPSSLRYLPVIESSYRTTAVSREGATGVWQFMDRTARGFGLTVNGAVDERRDPLRSTHAALDYLAALHERFGSWFLALAAWNAGPSRLDRILERHAPPGLWDDGTWWAIRSHLPHQTREFIPRFLAAAQVGSDPVGHGLDRAPAESRPDRLAFDSMTISEGASLEVVARLSGGGVEELETLNPHLLRGIAPPGVPTLLRLPSGSRERFLEAWRTLPAEERIPWLEHPIAQGETLEGISRQHGIRLTELQAANPGVDPRRLRIGSLLLIPRSAGSIAAR